MNTLVDDAKDRVKVALIDAVMADFELRLMSAGVNKVVLYSNGSNGQGRAIFTWRRGKHRPVISKRPLELQEAMAMVENNWDKRTFTAPS